MLVAVCGQKGGVGKSTVALALACEWHARGRSVAIIDADPQGTLRTWADVAAEAERPAPTVVGMGPGLHRPDQAPALAARFERVVLDCPPHSGEVLRAALAIADLALLPCGPQPMEAWALGETLALVEEARARGLPVDARILLTRVQRATSLGKTAREALAGCGVPILATELGLRTAFAEAPAAGMGPSTYQPSSAAADETRALVDEIERIAKGGRNRGR